MNNELDMNRLIGVLCLLFHLYCYLYVCDGFLNVQHLSKVSSVRSLHHHSNLLALSSRRDLVSISLLLSFAMKKGRNDEKEIGWGIVGLGDVCTVKAGPAFVKCDGSRLVAVMRRTPGAAAQWIKDAASFLPEDGCRPYDDLDQFLSDPDLDAVYIATPPQSHVQVAERVAQAGKIAYIEKPVGRCAAETQMIINAFETKKIPLFTAYTSRAFDRTRVIQQLLKDGIIGDQVTHISYKLTGSSVVRGLDTTSLPWRMDAGKSGGGLIMDVGCHLLDRLDYLFGPLIHVHGEAIKKSSFVEAKVEDYVNIHATIGTKPTNDNDTIIKAEGASVNCIWDFASDDDDPVDELRIVGSNGKVLQMAGQSPSAPIYVIDTKNDTIEQEITSFDVPQHTTQPLLQMIVNELLEKRQKKAPSRTDNALRTSKVLDTVLSSYYGNRDIGFWDHPELWPGLSKDPIPKT